MTEETKVPERTEHALLVMSIEATPGLYEVGVTAGAVGSEEPSEDFVRQFSTRKEMLTFLKQYLAAAVPDPKKG